jgi:hypothetical protein
MIKFRAKEFSSHIISDTLNGAKIGAATGALSSAVLGHTSLGDKIPILSKYLKTDSNEKNDQMGGGFNRRSLAITGGGLILGAALGALCGAVRDINEKFNRSTTVDNRMMKEIISDLKRKGFREGIDFTRDPKAASELKTKVCIAIYKYSNDLKILINTVNDYKLKTLTDKISKNVPNGAIKTNTTSDKFNEIVVSTISGGKTNDSDLVSEIANSFIKSGYPIYIVEVG